jgi:hypothetical protein
MTKKARPNEPCPCGSGKKFKKCCGGPGAKAGAIGLPHTQADRASAFEQLEFFIDELWDEEEEEAFEAFWGRHLEREGELSQELLIMSRQVQETWFAFDYRRDDGIRIIDEFLVQAVLGAGERSFLEAMRASTMRLYEVTETVPGSSMTLRDLVEGAIVTVSERSASRTVARHECLAARVIPRGCSGQPELEAGVLHIPSLWRESVLDAVRKHRSDFVRDHAGASIDAFYKLLPPLFHDAWLSFIFEPAIPRLANTDGEVMLITRVSFHVDDEGALAQALDSAEHEGLRRAGDGAWGWSGKSRSGAEVSLATLDLRGGVLTAEANSAERGERIRELVQRVAGPAIRYRATTHEDLERKVREAVTAQALGRDDEVKRPAPDALDPDLAEALVTQHYAGHYRAWVDEGVPALDGCTPREAAKSPGLRSRVEDLIRGLEGMYEHALKDGQPAYDPSWMWAELGLEAEADLSHPPPMAHERVAQQVPGSAEASRAAAERARARPSFSDTSTTLGDDELGRDLELQRFIRRHEPSANDAAQEGARAAPYLPLMVNLELHRRKVFWVDGALSYQLENTDLEVSGGDLRTPFPSFALVFTDRHALSLGERLLSRRPDDPLRGQILRVATVYVTEQLGMGGRVLAIVFAFDALGADLPSLVRYEVPADDAASLRAFLESVAPPTIRDAGVRDTSPARGLLRIVLNAVLYATSAGVTPALRAAAPHRASSGASGPSTSSDAVFFLPGTIDIRQVRRLQELARAPGGGVLLARFMVRGHWRRPAKNWAEQRLRWIEPYWKGPDMARVIEKAYRLRP